MVRGRAIIMCMVRSETPATDFPQGTVILIVIRRVFVAFETVRKRGGGLRLLAFLTRKEAKASFWNFPAFKTIVAIFVDPLRFGWTLCCVDTWDETGRR
jgi:hypothetical protein